MYAMHYPPRLTLSRCSIHSPDSALAGVVPFHLTLCHLALRSSSFDVCLSGGCAEGGWNDARGCNEGRFFLHFLLKCTKKGQFLQFQLKIAEKEGKTDQAAMAVAGKTGERGVSDDDDDDEEEPKVCQSRHV